MPPRRTQRKISVCKITEPMADEFFWNHNTPPKVKVHSIAVSRLAKNLAEQAVTKPKLKMETTPEHLYFAGLLHDVAKNPGKRSNDFDPEHSWKGGMALFKADKEVAKIAGYHDFLNFARSDLSFDQKLLIYCDLRIVGGKTVTLSTRINAIIKKWKKSPRYKIWAEEVKEAKSHAFAFQRLLEENGIKINSKIH